MIINREREPKYSLYYIGAKILEILKTYGDLTIEEIYNKIKKSYDDLSIDYIYYALDWLYILSLIKIEQNKVIIC